MQMYFSTEEKDHRQLDNYNGPGESQLPATLLLAKYVGNTGARAQNMEMKLDKINGRILWPVFGHFQAVFITISLVKG